MSQTIEAYYTITASSKFCEGERLRANARHDEAHALYNAKNEEKIEIAQYLVAMNMLLDQIIKTTGLTLDEIESLRA